MTVTADIISQTKSQLHGLVSELNNVKHSVCKWVQSKSDHISTIVEEHNTEYLLLQEQIEQKANEIQSYNEKIEQIKQTIEQEQRLEQKLQRDILQAREEIEQKQPKRLSSISLEYEELYKRLGEQKKVLQTQRKQRTEELNQSLQRLYPYQQFLGLKFEPQETQGIVKIIFTRIHPNDLDKKYSFNICIQNQSYNVTFCEPHVNFSEALSIVNKNNNFSKFLCRMRHLFCKTVQL